MRGMKGTFGKSALVALVLWFALAAGSVWASDHGTEQAASVDAHAVAADTHGAAVDAGHARSEERRVGKEFRL